MHPFWRTVPPLFLSVCACSTPGYAQTAAQRLTQAVHAYQRAQTMRVRFTQTWTNPLTGTTGTSHGVLLRRTPNFVSIDFTEPAADRIVSDGRALWIYLPSSAPKQVIKTTPPSVGGSAGSFDPLGMILSAPLDQYTVTDAGAAPIGGHPTHLIKLVPKGQKSPFTSATLWIDDANGSVRQLEMTEPSGIVRKITVEGVTTGVTLPRSAFAFIPAADVRVIER